MGMSRTPPDLPDVFAHLDYRAYLKAWFDARKKANPRFSHRMFARMAGHRSPSLLIQVIKGERNLGDETVERFSKAIGLDREQRDFFDALVEFDQAKTDAQRSAAWSRISAQRRFRDAQDLKGDGFRYLSHWYYPAIRELAQRPDFLPDPDWIASTLTPNISVAQAREALDELLELGLLVRSEGDMVVQGVDSVVTKREVANLAACNYHREMSKRAHDAVAEVDQDERYLLSVTVAIPAVLLPALKDALTEVQRRVLDMCDSSAEDADQVYQVNLQLFPLSNRRSKP